MNKQAALAFMDEMIAEELEDNGEGLTKQTLETIRGEIADDSKTLDDEWALSVSERIYFATYAQDGEGSVEYGDTDYSDMVEAELREKLGLEAR